MGRPVRNPAGRTGQIEQPGSCEAHKEEPCPATSACGLSDVVGRIDQATNFGLRYHVGLRGKRPLFISKLNSKKFNFKKIAQASIWTFTKFPRLDRASRSSPS